MAPERITPWGLIFASVEDRYEHLGDLASDVAAFSRNPEVQRLLADVETPALLETEPLAAAEYLHLLFADWQHWRHDRPVRVLTRDGLDEALATSRLPSPVSPVYVQIPARRFWLQPEPDGAHEPLDGCYVIPMGADELLVAAIVGLHPGRVGLSQVTLTVPMADLSATVEALPKDPFAPAMPGGAAAGVRSVRTAAELLHLVRVALAAGPA